MPAKPVSDSASTDPVSSGVLFRGQTDQGPWVLRGAPVCWGQSPEFTFEIGAHSVLELTRDSRLPHSRLGWLCDALSPGRGTGDFSYSLSHGDVYQSLDARWRRRAQLVARRSEPGHHSEHTAQLGAGEARRLSQALQGCWYLDHQLNLDQALSDASRALHFSEGTCAVRELQTERGRLQIRVQGPLIHWVMIVGSGWMSWTLAPQRGWINGQTPDQGVSAEPPEADWLLAQYRPVAQAMQGEAAALRLMGRSPEFNLSFTRLDVPRRYAEFWPPQAGAS